VSLINNIFSEDTNLKQSLECIETKAEHKQKLLNTRLEKLNKFGREIYSSYSPSDHP
jgi:hypothetical protein